MAGILSKPSLNIGLTTLNEFMKDASEFIDEIRVKSIFKLFGYGLAGYSLFYLL